MEYSSLLPLKRVHHAARSPWGLGSRQPFHWTVATLLPSLNLKDTDVLHTKTAIFMVVLHKHFFSGSSFYTRWNEPFCVLPFWWHLLEQIFLEMLISQCDLAHFSNSPRRTAFQNVLLWCFGESVADMDPKAATSLAVALANRINQLLSLDAADWQLDLLVNLGMGWVILLYQSIWGDLPVTVICTVRDGGSSSHNWSKWGVLLWHCISDSPHKRRQTNTE